MTRSVKTFILGAFIFAFSLANSTLPVAAWDQNYRGVWLKTSSNSGGFSWSGIQLLPQFTDFELVKVEDLINRSGVTRKGLIEKSDGTFSTPSFSLREVWQILQRDSNIIGVVPIGYLQGNGSVAGYLEIDDRAIGRIFIAPNLTSIYCVHSREFLRQSGFSDLKRQVPYLFPLKGGGAYREGSLEETLVFDRTDQALQKGFFSSCADQIQIGPRIIEPRKIGESDGLPGRFSKEIFDNDARGSTRRTVISWAYSGYLSIVSTRRPEKLESIARLISSDNFYVNTNRCTSAMELDNRSLSCEYWATAATSFEHSGLIIRENNGKVTSVGDIDSKIGAALIIRTKG